MPEMHAWVRRKIGYRRGGATAVQLGIPGVSFDASWSTFERAIRLLEVVEGNVPSPSFQAAIRAASYVCALLALLGADNQPLPNSWASNSATTALDLLLTIESGDA